jgi:hypothetical protein
LIGAPGALPTLQAISQVSTPASDTADAKRT